MEDNKIEIEELKKLANQMILVRSSFEQDHIGMLFKNISLVDYALIKKIYPDFSEVCITTHIYLQDLARSMNLQIPQISKLVQSLQDKGLLYWEHDTQGTYVRLTEIGLELMNEQQRLLLKYFKSIIERIGKDQFIEMMQAMSKLEMLMEEEALKIQED